VGYRQGRHPGTGLRYQAEISARRIDQNRFQFNALSKRRDTLSQIQGRSCANIFGLVERFVDALVLNLSRDHFFGNHVALEALIRFADEEKHQELFRRIDRLMADQLPVGNRGK
jgi:hypothetical protein